MLSLAAQLDDKVIAPEVSAAVAIGFSGETYSMAVSARSDVVIAGGLSDVATGNPSPGYVSDVLDPTFNILTIAGAKIDEVGVFFARNFEIMGKKLSVGFTPKIIFIQVVEYSESIIAASTDLTTLTDNSVKNLDDFTTFDVGVIFGLTENIKVGLTAKNLITEEVKFTTIVGSQTITTILSFETQLKTGLAYSNEFITIGADLDVTENDSVVPGGLKTKNMSVGVEIDVFDIAQARVGMMKNLADGISVEAEKVLYTASLGFSLGFNLDIAVIAGDGSSAGAFIQAGFKF